MDTTKALEHLIDEWIAARNAAAALLVTNLKLTEAHEVLDSKFRGRHILPGTGWAYRTHGIGVDVTRVNGKDGIDFDFSEKENDSFAIPDCWRLMIFAKRRIHGKKLDATVYLPLLQDEDHFRSLVNPIIARKFSSKSDQSGK